MCDGGTPAHSRVTEQAKEQDKHRPCQRTRRVDQHRYLAQDRNAEADGS